MVKTVLNGARKAELAACYIMGLWTIAFGGSLFMNYEIPVALNVAMPGAAGILLGIKLPVGKEPNGK